MQRKKQLIHLLIPAALIAAAWVAQWGWQAQTLYVIFMVAAALYAGAGIAQEAWNRLKHKQFSIPLLITVASVGALFIGEVWEAAAVTFLYKFGTYLENMTLSRTREALRDLIDLRPLTALVRGDEDEWTEVPADSVAVGQRVLVRPGGKVPVDGVVRQGRASVDTAALTGEPLPKDVAVGDEVLSGSVVVGGSVEVEAERVATETTFNRLIRLVAMAQGDKPRLQRFVDRFAQWYTPAVMLTAVILFLWSKDVKLALTFLVIGCPGALVVAAPVAVVAGLGRAARTGMLIKGGERLEQIGRLDTVAFDKTGTLTEGTPQVSTVIAFTGNEEDVLAVAAAAEERSEHHLAAAILAYAAERGVATARATDWTFYPGLGVGAETEAGHVLVGNRRLMEQANVNLAGSDDAKAGIDAAVAERGAQGDALAYVALDGRLIGLIGIEDTVRPEAFQLVSELKRAGIRHAVMLTGDHAAAALKVAGEIGIDEVKAGLLPEDKVEAVKQLQGDGRVVAMIGDGINDAPALATADVSIAMGTSGTQVAMESADIVLVEDRLDKIPVAIRLSRDILRIVKQNVAIAVGTVLLLLAGVITRHVGLGLGMLVHEASILIVIANGMRLLRPPKAGEQPEADGAPGTMASKPVPEG